MQTFCKHVVIGPYVNIDNLRGGGYQIDLVHQSQTFFAKNPLNWDVKRSGNSSISVNVHADKKKIHSINKKMLKYEQEDN